MYRGDGMVKYQPFYNAQSEMENNEYGPVFDTVEKAAEWLLDQVEKCVQYNRKQEWNKERRTVEIEKDCGRMFDIRVVDVPVLLKVGITEPCEPYEPRT